MIGVFIVGCLIKNKYWQKKKNDEIASDPDKAYVIFT